MNATRGPAAQRHVPVLRDRIVELLAPAAARPGAVLVDATLGMGGHSEALLTACPNARVVGIDRDTEALALAGERLAVFGDRFTTVHAVYDDIAHLLVDLDVPQVDGILFDLGVSSLQLDEADRGFAYAQDAPLDMRMDPTTGPTAADVLAAFSEGELRRIFERYGDEKLAGRYARAIIAERAIAPITTSAHLVRVLTAATPGALLGQGHPAKRVFQALRIEVNGELAALDAAIPAGMDLLRVGGRIVVMSYQSLEDRLVKQDFARAIASTAPAGLPVELPEHAPRFRLLVKGAELADEEERARNSRAIPVRLRAAERVREAAPAPRRRQRGEQ